jgi:hypothetical protein
MGIHRPALARLTIQPPARRWQAETAFAAADKALRSGDLAAYQKKIEEAQAATQQALRALGR